MDNFTEQLDWDSHFFGKKIAKIVVDHSDEKYIEEKLSEYQLLGFNLVYVCLANKAILPPSLCKMFHCKWVDCKMTYSTYVEKDYQTPPLVEEFKGDASLLYELAFLSGINSRYKIDTHFDEEDFKRLYRIWVDNSVKHIIANKVFVCKEEEHICGFITVNVHNEESSIGLIAINPKQQGQGIGSALITAVKKYVKDEKAPNLNVATQKENTLACSFYEKNGFSLKSETNIYHAWLKNE